MEERRRVAVVSLSNCQLKPQQQTNKNSPASKMLTSETLSNNFWTDFLNLLLERDEIDFLIFFSTIITENVC